MRRLLGKLGFHSRSDTFRINVIRKDTLLGIYRKDAIVKRRVFVLFGVGDILRRNKLYRNVHSGGISTIRCVQVNQCNAAGVQNRLQRDKVELGIHAIECSVNLGTLGPIGQLLRSFNDFDVRKDKGRYRNLDLGNGILVEVHIKRKSILEERAIGNRERRRIVDRFHVNNDGPYFAHDRMICSFDKNIRERVVTMEIQFRTIDKRTQLGELGQLAMLG